MLNYAGEPGNDYTAIAYSVAASPAVTVTAVTSVAKSYCRQIARVAEGFSDSRWE